MKKKTSCFQISFYTAGFMLLLGLTACKKTSPGNMTSENSFSFMYNGIKHDLNPVSYEYGVDSLGFWISKLDIFSAPISFKSPDCAYYASDNSSVSVSGNCQLTNGSGLPIDSAAVYIYQSGSMNVTYSHCSSTSLIDFSGNHVTAQYCDMEGSFNLVLKNSENKLITLSDGHFIQYHMLRSWK